MDRDWQEPRQLATDLAARLWNWHPVSMTETARRSLARLLSESGAQGLDPAAVTFSGADDLYSGPFLSGHATGVALAAAILAARPEARFTLDLDHAALISKGYRHILLNGQSVAAPRDPLTGFYETGDGRQIFLHVNFPHHRARALALLRAEPTRESLQHAIGEWKMPVLDAALMACGAISAPVLMPQEWHDLAPALPLVSIEKISNSAPQSSDSVRVVDFTRVLAGPTCGRLLAELGADVTRIDNPLYPDLVSYRLDANRNKKEVTLDLRQAEQRAEIFARIKTADVFLQAYRPGVAEQLGLSAETLGAQHAGLIHASLSAYDDGTVFAGRRGFDSAVQAASGMALIHGEGSAKLLPTSPLDYAAGFLLAFGVNEALRRRAREGGSYRVRTSLARVASWLLRLRHEHTPPENAARMADMIATYSQDSVTPLGVIRHIASPKF